MLLNRVKRKGFKFDPSTHVSDGPDCSIVPAVSVSVDPTFEESIVPLVFHSSRAASSSSGIFIKPLFPLPSPATRAVRNPTQIAPPTKFESSLMFPFHHVLAVFPCSAKIDGPDRNANVSQDSGLFSRGDAPLPTRRRRLCLCRDRIKCFS